jgi:hypothetical protein
MLARLATSLVLALALIAPAAAQAADTYTVDPADANGCGTTDKTCPNIGQALQAAKAGDTISILKGTYPESVNLAAGKDGLKFKGAGAADVKITGSGTGDVFALASKDVEISGLTIDVPTNAKSAVNAAETGAVLSSVVMQRTNSSAENVGVIEVADTGTLQLTSGYIIQSIGTAGTPAIHSGNGGATILDTVVVSSTGPALVMDGSDKNVVQRSTLVSTQADSDALRLISNDAGARKLIVDSSYFVGGANVAGVLAQSTGNAAGDIALELRHATIAGSAKGIVLDASGATGPGLPVPAAVGNIDGKVFSSIVHGVSETKRYAPAIPGISGTANTAALTFANSDAPPATANNGTVEMGGATNTEDAKLFAPKGLHLRADAPLIDKGGALQAGESTKDADGDAREVDGPDADATPQSDIGADEYVNQPPKALFGITNKNPRQGEAIGFVSGSTDPEQGAGGGIVEYRWDFGDGSKETTKVGGVAHTYTALGTYQATLQVVDAQGLVSAVTAPQAVVVKDGVPPEVAVTAPVEGNLLNLKSTFLLGAKKPKPRQLTVLGTVADLSGIDSVEVTLYLTKRDAVKKAKKKKKKKTAKKSQVKLCEFYSGRVFSKKDCTKEIWLKATLVPGGWTLKTKKGLRLPAGRYTVRVRAKDTTGLLTSGFSTKARTLVNFRIK